VEIVKSVSNAGFSAGNNLGVAAARDQDSFDGFLLTNSDTVLRRGSLKALSTVLCNEPETGVVGPRLEWPSGEVQASCFRAISPVREMAAAAKTGFLSRLIRGDLPIPMESEDGSDPDVVDWISFACVLVRSGTLNTVGPMDEGFFMYFEDVDYCLRARKAGWRIAYAPEARVVHLRGGRTPDEFALQERGRRPRFYYESRSRYLAKHYGRTGPLRANICWTLGRGLSWLREFAASKVPHTADREAGDIWTGALCGFSRRLGAHPGAGS
jgi:hypothetical protein